MRTTFVLLAAVALSAAPAAAQSAAPAPIAKSGVMLRSADQARLGQVSRVNSDGSVQIIFDTTVKTIPASTLSMVDGKLVTSLTKSAVSSLR
ncbi:hypothetical protein [uncultured Sphingomonas sp.]|uniref:hypothetical protein n=1 Tax=uncultured Sphingomonas sp. TaxID=158754 RepID=UPI0035CC514B